MSSHRTTTVWSREGHPFTYDGYSRDHDWRFPVAPPIRATAAPDFKGNPSLVNPEDALVAAISGCHLLTFLAVCARAGLVVDAYEDEAEGTLEMDPVARKRAVTRCTLRPKVTFAGEAPSAEKLEELHDKAHAGCFIANSVKTAITIEPR